MFGRSFDSSATRISLSAESPGPAPDWDRQHLYGLTVAADHSLRQYRCGGDDVPDVVVRIGDPVPATTERPVGQVLLDFEKAHGAGYLAVRRPDGRYLLRFDGSAEFQISADLRLVTAHPVIGAADGIATVLTTGGMLAFQLYLRGLLVLHASAVDVGGASVAFTGHQGMGKSTMAAVLCAAGARLITDDVLRVDFNRAGPAEPVARLGATGVRLRKGADTLAAGFGAAGCRTEASADGRQVLQLSDDADDRLPLRALVVPFPDRAGGPLRVRRLDRKRALLVMLGLPRLPGWVDESVLSRQFDQLAALVSRVPVITATVPWGPPFAQEMAGKLLDLIGDDSP